MNIRIKILFLSFFISILSSCAGSEATENFLKKTMLWQGIEREYLIFLPASYSPEVEIPLVVGLHGYTGTASGFEKETTKGMNLHAEYRNYIAVYPQGVNFWDKMNGMPFFVSSWNDLESNAPPRKGERPICIKSRGEYPRPKECKEYSHCAWTGCYDDIGFIKKVIEKVTEEYAVDKSRRYLSGISNGGAMAHRFACLHPEMLAAAASISGSIPRDRSCAPKIPISYLQVFGDKDTVTPINGKVSSDGWFYEKPEISFNKWAESMGCTEEIEASNLLTAESSNLICSSRRSCSKGRSLEVINCLVPDGGHAWPGQKPGVGFCRSKEQGSSIPNQKECLDNNGKEINWGNEVIWEFFSKHRRENV